MDVPNDADFDGSNEDESNRGIKNDETSEVSGDDSISASVEEIFCTRAVTGPDLPAHQPIFVCMSCRVPRRPTRSDDDLEEGDDDSGDLPPCVCRSCAEVCHADHDVRYVGVGPCTCDCPSLEAIPTSPVSSAGGGYASDGASISIITPQECRLEDVSLGNARRLGFGQAQGDGDDDSGGGCGVNCLRRGRRKLNAPFPRKIPPSCEMLPRSLSTEKSKGNDDNNNDVPDAERDPDPPLDLCIADLLCIECRASSLGGYAYDSYTLPSLSVSRDRCDDLVRQAVELTNHSHDTFWMTAEDEDGVGAGGEEGRGEGTKTPTEWCDLELMARDIYRRHVRDYGFDDEHNDPSDAPQHSPRAASTTAPAGGRSGGAEWWVQVKPAGSNRAPVDLHYDKDETLAEIFGLGSFPTLSTVTYLTGGSVAGLSGNDGDDAAPTIIFPHTYYDEESRPISSMLLSRAVRGKHLVFDGRLLHGAPAHPSLRRGGENRGVDNAVENTDGDGLRATFLVNIWRTGRPAGVRVLDKSIRNRVQSISSSAVAAEVAVGAPSRPFTGSLLSSLYPLEFRKLTVTHRSVSSSYRELKKDFRGGDDDNGKAESKGIVLPFVSHGATWIDNGDSKEEDNDGRSKDGKINDYESGNDDEEEKDDELVLVLPPSFALCQDGYDRADTILLSFEDGNEPRLKRLGAREEEEVQDCRWKNLMLTKEDN